MGDPVLKTDEASPAEQRNLLLRLWHNILIEPLERIDREARAFQATPQSRGPDWKVIAVLLTAAVSLTLQNYFVQEHIPWVAQRLAAWNIDYWVFGCMVTYFVIPASVIRLLFRERIRDYGIKLKGAFADWWIYGVMFAIMVPLVFVMSGEEHFKRMYPMGKLHPNEEFRSWFWRWEFQYAIQFFGLEFFFRGFLVHGTKHRFGWYAIFVMTVPYCMIHYQKPMPEAFGSIVAGIALGFMSLKTRSIWMGASIHVTVAYTMDFASLWRQGYFG